MYHSGLVLNINNCATQVASYINILIVFAYNPDLPLSNIPNCCLSSTYNYRVLIFNTENKYIQWINQKKDKAKRGQNEKSSVTAFTKLAGSAEVHT